jgi:cobalamin biosynthesis Mg chelatase CobN
MNSTPLQSRGSGRSASLLLSVLALLAFACFPVLAQAGESFGPQYETEVPTVKGHTTPPNTSGGSPAHSSKVPGGSPATGSNPSNGNVSHSSGGSSSGGDNPSTGAGGGTGQANPGNGSTTTNGQNTGQQTGAPSGGQPVSPQPASDDSSSPLVPILIAIAVLAAISIGAVVIRQRRQRRSPGAQVSPKAS